MSATEVKPLARKVFDPAGIARDYPPVIKSRKIRLVYDIADAAHSKYAGPMTYSRWAAIPLPAEVPARAAKMKVVGRPDFFTYEEPAAGNVGWHLNFAHHDLFAFYGGGLFAQDEMQVAEHPILASLREALLAEKLSTFTVEAGKPTPILVRGAQRRVRVNTDANASEGRRGGLYGNAFARADDEVIRKATALLEPPTISNILAMEAPAGGRGEYTAEQIRYILTTAYTGFRAAKLESAGGDTQPVAVTIHTGFWGCGAYGGNRILMTMLQLYAAQLAGVDGVVYHTGDKEGLRQFNDARMMLEKLAAEARGTEQVIDRLVRSGFRWGVSDGN